MAISSTLKGFFGMCLTSLVLYGVYIIAMPHVEDLLVSSRAAEPLPEREITAYFFSNGGNITGPQPAVKTILTNYDSAYLQQIVAGLSDELENIYSPEELSTARVYNKYGRIVENTAELEDNCHLYVLVGIDRFVWPAPWIGYSIPLLDVPAPHSDEPLTMVVVSQRPRLFSIENYIADQEIVRLLEIAQGQMAPAGLVMNGKSVPASEDINADGVQTRNSLSTFLRPGVDPVVDALDLRSAVLNFAPVLDADAIQVVHYEPGQHYHLHYDNPDGNLMHENDAVAEGVKRQSTTFFYLNDVEEGGETLFIRGGEDGVKPGEGYKNSDCDRGLKITPKRGMAVLWYNIVPEGMMGFAKNDYYSLHAGCDVIKGEKWGANKWIYNKRSSENKFWL